MEKNIFFVLHLEMFLCAIYSGKIISRNVYEKYWSYALFPILSYGVVSGLRFGRMVDWNLYYHRYIEMGNDFWSSDYEICFRAINYSFYNLGFPYWFFIFSQCLFLMISMFILFKNYKNEILYILPISLVLIHNNELYIRWYTAFSFFLISLSFMIRGEKIKSILFFLIACLTHFGIILLFPIIIFSNILNKYSIHPLIGCSLYIFVLFSMSITQLSFLSSFTDNLLKLNIITNESAIYYMNNTDALINGEFGGVGFKESDGILKTIRLLVGYLPLILFSLKSCKNRKYGVLEYNVFVIGVVLSPLFYSIEITDRYAGAMTFFGCLCAGHLAYDTFIENATNTSKFQKILISVCLISNIWPLLSICWTVDNINEMLYIWDANGRKYLPY